MPHLKIAAFSLGGTFVALQTWSQVNTALAGAALETINAARPYFGPIIIALAIWILGELRYNTRITLEKNVRHGNKTTANKSEPLQRDSVHERDV